LLAEVERAEQRTDNEPIPITSNDIKEVSFHTNNQDDESVLLSRNDPVVLSMD